MYPEINPAPQIPVSKKRFQTAMRVARSWTKYKSLIVAWTSTSYGAIPNAPTILLARKLL
jgi:hypothetical protein